jgi:hypothetical protein
LSRRSPSETSEPESSRAPSLPSSSGQTPPTDARMMNV